jgi:hypothetical protein
MSSLTEIAQQLMDSGENICLIYGFNSTGKTKLSVAYKDLTKAINNGKHAGVYYNAYSEDLFVWDNDEENNNANIKLDIIHSSLNQFHSLLILNPDSLKDKLALYNPKYLFKFNPSNDPEKGIDSITFSLEENGSAIKISSGEARIFVWCFFLALFEVDGWADVQDAHFFIDDPVSSLDDHNIFVTAQSIFDLTEINYLKKRIIISTHHIGLFSILFDWFVRGDRSGKLSKLTKPFILSNRNGQIELKSPTGDVFLYHLHLLQTLKDSAAKKEFFVYHFVLLRQALENLASFLGTSRIGFVLSEIKVRDVNQTMDKINSLSHKNTYSLQFKEMSATEEDLFTEVLDKLIDKYNFKLH